MLLDTCTFLWMRAEPTRIPLGVRQAIANHGGPVFLSVVSSWEIAAKYSRGLLSLPAPPSRWLRQAREESGVASLALDEPTAALVEALPWHHKDPFDRMLIAVAIAYGLEFVTPDPLIVPYPVRTRW